MPVEAQVEVVVTGGSIKHNSRKVTPKGETLKVDKKTADGWVEAGVAELVKK